MVLLWYLNGNFIVFIWYLLPTQNGDISNFLAPLVCTEQKLFAKTNQAKASSDDDQKI